MNMTQREWDRAVGWGSAPATEVPTGWKAIDEGGFSKGELNIFMAKARESDEAMKQLYGKLQIDLNNLRVE